MKNRLYGLFAFLVVVLASPQDLWALSCPPKRLIVDTRQ